MPEFITEPLAVKREVEVQITTQARRILTEAGINVNDFLDWCLLENKISFGGHNVMLYLENKYEKEVGK